MPPKIFINDEHNGWYVHGIPGVGDVNKSIDFLFNILQICLKQKR